jgi:tRNA A37 threonylcarbamoyltransferase TsaD
VSAHHAEKILPLIKQALDIAKITRKEINAIAFTKGLLLSNT